MTMSINDGGISRSESPNYYEEFEDLESYNNFPVNSAESLVPDQKFELGVINLDGTIKKNSDRVERLHVEEVRWFYQSGKKKRWKPFIGSDSISIESEWRCISQSDREIQRVCVRGGMYEVDVLEKKCYPIYWSPANIKGMDDNIDIIRGTWFYESNFMPLNEEIAAKIEVEHIERWKECSLDEVKSMTGSVAMHSVKLDHCHVDWYSVNDVYLHSDTVSHRALRNIVQKFGASKTSTSGNKLHRGYREDAMHEDCMPPVEHLVFMVHGIGSKTDRQKIVRNTNEFRQACDKMMAKHFAHFTGRVEFLPVEWRSELHLDDGVVETLMPRKSLGVRQFLNNNAMDIMYYTSPLYKSEIVDALRDRLTQLHKMFIERNPSFNGKISIFAHSLGSVIMHDIMTGWSPESLFDDYLKKTVGKVSAESIACGSCDGGNSSERLNHLQNDMKTLSRINQPRHLNFSVENFFCVGSPLGIFVALRGHRPCEGLGTQDDIIPKNVCRRIFNLYHPADPIAYRLEPLVLSHYITIAPLQVHSSHGMLLIPYDELPPKPFAVDSSRELGNFSSSPALTNDNLIEETEVDNGSDVTEKSIIPVSSAAVQNFQEMEERSGGSTPKMVRRQSYLRAISGSAVRVGRAIWNKTKGGSQTQAVDQSEVGSQESISISEDGQESGQSESPSRDDDDDRGLEMRSVPELSANKREKSEITGVDSMQLENRLDYELQEGFTESKLGYASLTSHTSYWGNQDVALFVMMQIHPHEAIGKNAKPRM